MKLVFLVITRPNYEHWAVEISILSVT